MTLPRTIIAGFRGRDFSLWLILALTVLSWWGVVACAKPFLVHPAVQSEDPDPPSEVGASINAAGDELTIVFDSAVTVPDAGNNRIWLNASVGHPTLAYASGSGTDTIVFDIVGRVIYQGETVTLEAEQCAIDGVDDFADLAVTNNSTQTYTPSGTALTAADKAADGIIYIDDPGTYYLSEDISFDGAGIAICDNNVTLDGNFHTITVDNATPISLTNPGFENGTTGWDFTNAADASIHTPADTDYAWLNNELFEGESSLIFSDCTEDQYVETSSTITLAANTNYVISAMVHYGEGQQPSNPGVKPYVRLMNGSTPLEGKSPTDSGPRGQYWIGVGDHQTNDTNKDFAEWVSGRTYVANNYAIYEGTQYRCTTGNSDTEFNPSNWTADAPTYSFNRGIQLLEMRYTTGGSPENVDIRIGIVGHASGTDEMYFDDIRVTRTRCYGVTCSLATDANSTFMHEYDTGGHSTGSNTGVVIKNLRIVQGQDNGSWCHGVVLAKNDDTEVQNCTVEVTGNNSSCVGTFSQTNNDRLVTVDHCKLVSNIDALTSRDNTHGVMLASLRGDVTHNAFWDGPAVGIAVASIGSNVSYNRLSMKCRYTNAVAIGAGGGGSSVTLTTPGVVSHNTIISNKGGTGFRAGPGMLLSNSDETDIYDNYVNVRLRARNQEYSHPLGGDQQNGVYGIQVESGSNKNIYDNYVEVGTEYGEGHCMRIGGADVPYENIDVYGNTFRAMLEEQDAGVDSDKDICSIYRMTFLEGSENTTIHDNVGYTNSRIFGTSGNINDQVFEGDTYYVYAPEQPGATFQVAETYAGQDIVDLTFLDPIFGTELAATEMRESVIVNGSGTPDAGCNYAIKWTTTVHVQDAALADVSGATVTIDDNVPTEVFSDTTDASGDTAAILTESLHESTGVTNYNNHTAEAVSGMLGDTLAFPATSTQTITLTVE